MPTPRCYLPSFKVFAVTFHSESIDHIVATAPVHVQGLMRVQFIWNRSLDKGNPHPGAIGSDFNRLGVDFWDEVYALHARNERRRELLQELIDWRNAIAHQDFNAVAPAGDPTLHLETVRNWRRAVNTLARCFDRVMCNYLGALLGASPW
jgi:hypothetical protein